MTPFLNAVLLAAALLPLSSSEETPPVLRPVPAYLQDNARRFQSAPSVTVSPGGRLWLTWHTGDITEGDENCHVVVSSGDGGNTWTGPLFTPAGKLLIQMRVDDIQHGGKAAQVQVSDDGKTASYDPASGFVSMPGGCKKFVIKFDEVSKRYWSLVNWVHPDDVNAPDKERVRNTLALVCSDDLKNWDIRTIVLRHPSTKIGFQYCDWRVEGDDLVFVCRLAWNGAPNCHDANYLTFHRLKTFRTLTRANDAAPFAGD